MLTNTYSTPGEPFRLTSAPSSIRGLFLSLIIIKPFIAILLFTDFYQLFWQLNIAFILYYSTLGKLFTLSSDCLIH